MKRKFRPQFSVSTLLAIVSISALVAHWYAACRRASHAEHAWNAARFCYQMGMKTDEDIHQASVDLLQAELATPFSDRHAAYSRHLERVVRLEQVWRQLPRMVDARQQQWHLFRTAASDERDDFQRACLGAVSSCLLPQTAIVCDDAVDLQRKCDERADRILVWCKEAERWAETR